MRNCSVLIAAIVFMVATEGCPLREYEYPIVTAPQNGLRPHPLVERNADYMFRMINMKPVQGQGAVTFEPVSMPIDGGVVDIDHPWPAIFRGPNYYLLADKATISTLDADWNSSALDLYRAENPTVSFPLGLREEWRSALFQDIWFLSNGWSFVFNVPSAPDNKVLGTNALNVGALCTYENTLVLGGLSGNWFHGVRWARVFDAWRETQHAKQLAHEDLSFDTHWIMWFARDTDDVPFHFALAALGVFGDAEFDKWESVIINQVEAGIIGMRPMSMTGGVKAVRQLGSKLVAYGETGLGRMVWANGFFDEEYSDEINIRNPGALGGTQFFHLFVAATGDLYKLPPTGEAKKLDYSAYLYATEPEDKAEQDSFVWGEFDGAGGDNKFFLPQGLGLSADYVFVSDARSIQKFLPDGTFVGREVPGPSGSFRSTDIAVDEPNELIYVADWESECVKVYDFDLVWQQDIGGPGGGPGDTDGACSVTLYAGELFVLHTNCVSVFDATTGVYSRQWPTNPGQYWQIREVNGEIWAGNQYGLAPGEHSIIRLDTDGNFIAGWGPIAEHRVSAFCVADNEVFIYSVPVARGLLVYDMSGTLLRTFPCPANPPGSYPYVSPAKLDGGILYTLDRPIPPSFEPVVHAWEFGVFMENPILISMDPLFRDFWIVDDAKCHVYTIEGKLGGPMDVRPTSLVRTQNGTLIGIAPNTTSETYTFWLTTHPFDIRERDFKHMAGAHVTSEGVAALEGRAEYRMDYEGSWVNGPWHQAWHSGAIWLNQSFIDGRLSVKGTIDNGDQGSVSRMEIRYNAEGRNASRGTGFVAGPAHK